jgi:cyclomaltodextrinase / maltogenic alpha-amylase / neopullulanase
MISEFEARSAKMSNNILICPIAVGLMFYSFLFFGCAEKNFSGIDARTSAEWVKDAVIYQVNLHSFSGDGTFNGLEKRISELKKIGVTVISLMPIYPVGELNRKGSLGNPYAVKDYYAVNPEFGTSSDFKSLVNALHQQDLKIVIDLAASYTAWDSQLLMEHPDWFKHDEEGAIISPDIMMPDVAQLDYNQHEPKKYMIAVMKYWVNEFDIDGFNCTNAESIPMDFWNIARKELDKIKTVMMIADFAEPKYHIRAFDLTSSWDIYNNIPSIVNQTISAIMLDGYVKSEYSDFPKGSLHLRFNNTYRKIESAQPVKKFNPQEARIIAVLKFTIPGVPIICSGEEVGNDKYPDLYEKVEIDWSNGKNFRELYEQLAKLRCGHPALRNGSYLSISNSEFKTVYTFLRSSGKDSLIAVINFGSEDKVIELKMPTGSSLAWKDQLSGTRIRTKDASLNLTLPPLSYALLVPEYERTAK